MTAKKPQYLSLEDVIIPAQKLERRNYTRFQFAPSRITGLADATYDIEMHVGNSHSQMQKLTAVDYKKVRYVNIAVEGFGGYGSCCPTWSKKNYEELRKRCPIAFDNEHMIGQPVTVVYRNNMFAGFVAPVTYSQDIRRSQRRKKAKA